MSITPESNYRCARCGADVGNGGVTLCVVVSDLDPDNPGMVRNLRYCRDHTDDNGDVVKGCSRKLLSPSMLTHHTETQEAARG